MLQSLLREYRLRRMAQFTFWTIVSWIVLRVLSAITHAVPVFLWAFVWIGIVVAAVYYVIRLIRFIQRRLLWRLSRRLAVTYVFIAFVPVLLILLLVGLGALIVNGQFAAFLVSGRLRNHFDELKQLNRVVAHEATRIPARNPKQLFDGLQSFYFNALRHHLSSYPDLQITLRAGGQARAFNLTGAAISQPIAQPPWLSQEEWSGVVMSGAGVSLRAVEREVTGTGRLTLILSMPVTPQLLNMVGQGIGPVGVVPLRAGRARTMRINTTVEVHTRPVLVNSKIQSSAVPLPPPHMWFDLPVLGASSLAPIRWNTAKLQPSATPVLVWVNSRIFTLNDQLFRTLGEFAGFWEVVFIVVGAVFLIIELAALIIGITLTRTITSTVNRLQSATERVKAGDFSHRIGLPPRDQLSALGGAFDSMTASVERLLVESKEKTKLEGELKIARDVQKQLFPQKVPEIPGVELYGVCHPAREVSGDYYDFLKLGADHVGLVLADVSGKGIFAALLMASIQSAVHAQFYDGHVPGRLATSEDISPAELMARLNRQLYASTSDEKYATFFYAVYDCRACRLAYTNCGHPAPFLLRREKLLRLEDGGTVLGLFPNVRFAQSQVEIEPGDVLLAFTDGMTEPENSYGEEFGEQRLIGTLRQALDGTPEELTEEVYRRITDWTGSAEPQDDMTMVYLRAL
jgi:phosphoserine phosphatase RsbU/P